MNPITQKDLAMTAAHDERLRSRAPGAPAAMTDEVRELSVDYTCGLTEWAPELTLADAPDLKMRERARSAEAQVATLTVRLETAMEALRPFADICDAEVYGFDEPLSKLGVHIYFLREARAVVRAAQLTDGEE